MNLPLREVGVRDTVSVPVELPLRHLLCRRHMQLLRKCAARNQPHEATREESGSGRMSSNSCPRPHIFFFIDFFAQSEVSLPIVFSAVFSFRLLCRDAFCGYRSSQGDKT